uniref:Uncharacterized protein n=1 Tax=Aegilops tauschii subsp. strangulata TaxID=200361 RepID=A0A453IDJ6_AEGTS
MHAYEQATLHADLLLLSQAYYFPLRCFQGFYSAPLVRVGSHPLDRAPCLGRVGVLEQTIRVCLLRGGEGIRHGWILIALMTTVST